AGIGMILDEMPGDEAAGAMADEYDLLVTEPAQVGNVLAQFAARDDSVDGGILTVCEDVNVSGLAEFLDERTVWLLPGSQRGLGNAFVFEVQIESVNHDNRGCLVIGSRPHAVGWSGGDFFANRLNRVAAAERESAEEGPNRDHGVNIPVIAESCHRETRVD